ncbi:MAG: hypothetical protein ACREDR_08670, partial [Blastocatellia bacterium]
ANPPERSDYEPGAPPPEHPRQPSQRQILKLCEDYFFNGDPPPEPDAHYYTDIRVLLAAVDPLSWKGYAGAYLYAMFKNRLRRREEMRKNQSRQRQQNPP